MEMLDTLFWTLVGGLAFVTLDPLNWTSRKPITLKVKNLDNCRCFWCS